MLDDARSAKTKVADGVADDLALAGYADRSLSSMITRSNSVLLTANLADGSFFLSRVVASVFTFVCTRELMTNEPGGNLILDETINGVSHCTEGQKIGKTLQSQRIFQPFAAKQTFG